MYIWERYCLPLVCTFKKAINCFQMKVGVQKGALSFKIVLIICASFIPFTLSFIDVIWLSSPMTTISILVRVLIWVYGIFKLGQSGLMI